ncbi:probable LRR receptor-like serine/threonine-protein kinase At3g47570 [Pyrus x bretschneideri]|uniref:probable LRR receptor-like serine/threonine-protein kinase At3g47570 n=1 Tax=Pyrus x bretschneideri TaxID=225117 RepID=UPI00202EF1C0|nr:probable LRR receptor-like serine/threonine-protein kinase At3g47570 [Pyrus x bretschneideri]
MVIGTILGHRRGHMWLCIQHDHLCNKPTLLLKLSVSTHQTRPARFVKYPASDKLHLFFGGDDAVVKYWDVTGETPISDLLDHKDYLRCGGEIWVSKMVEYGAFEGGCWGILQREVGFGKLNRSRRVRGKREGDEEGGGAVGEAGSGGGEAGSRREAGSGGGEGGWDLGLGLGKTGGGRKGEGIRDGLGLSNNRFGGEVPKSIANLSTQLQVLAMGGNLLHGSLPNGIGNLINLIILEVSGNYLTGVVPEEIGKLEKIGQLYLGGNKFFEPIPLSLGNMTSLIELGMERNSFEGSIPPSLGNCPNLLLLSLHNNNLTSSKPKKLMELSTLSISLDLSNNFLTGSLPSEVGDLVHLTQLDVSNNKLSGDIPSTLGGCASLERLYLDDNKFKGTIPQSLKDLKGLEELDISSNNLSGQILKFIGKLGALKYLDLSYNDFEGELPKEEIFSNFSAISVLGNHRLCDGIPQLHLPACPENKHHSSRGLLSPKVVIPISCALAFIIALSCFFSARSMLKKSREGLVTSRSYKDWKLGVSYSQLVESTNGFSVDNLIGSGSFGSVYKGVIPSDGTVVAVKVLNLQQQGASKSFNDECKALRSVRHRNLLKIITACSSIDNHGRDFKSLVFEFMPNGSLDSWLHPRDEEQSPSKRLNFMQRLNIAIDVASVLDYLHNHCETSIVHCDLKPSIVLLDEDMVARVGDFGLARFLLEASNDPSLSQTMSSQLKGSIGYILLGMSFHHSNLFFRFLIINLLLKTN